MLSLLQFEIAKIKTEMVQRTNRVNLHLALGGSFDASPAAAPPNTFPNPKGLLPYPTSTKGPSL
jgi:hypothetical protein